MSLYAGLLKAGVAAGALHPTVPIAHIAETVVALEDAFDLHLSGRNSAIDRNRAVQRVLGYLAMATGTPMPRRRRP